MIPSIFVIIDTLGRYAFDQQPAGGFWNLQRLAQAETLIPVEKVEEFYKSINIVYCENTRV